jgi:hypothetical protein
LPIRLLLNRSIAPRVSLHLHNPPHFHAVCGEWEASIRISDFGLMAGKLPPRIFGQVIEWAALHQGELIQEWDNMRAGRQLSKIQPLQ